MSKLKKFLLIDTETCQDGTIYDFVALVVDRHGKIYHTIVVIIYENSNKELFNNNNSSVFSKANLISRKYSYDRMLERGERSITSINGINNWLTKVYKKYPDITHSAYNLNFDEGAMIKTGIIYKQANPRLCLWYACAHIFAKSKRYITYCNKSRLYSPKIIIKTSAEVMYNYLFNEFSISIQEPHTALEDCYLERDILVKLLQQRKKMDYVYNWRDFTVQKCFERFI